MTISTETRRAGPYSGNGSTQVFAFSFKTFAAADLQVVTTTDGVDTVRTLTTHYTVSLNSDQNASPGGSITMLTAPASGTTLTIISDRAFAQTLNVQNAGAFLPDAINTALDTLVVQTTQLLDQQDRSLRGALSDGVMNRLPTAAERAGGLLGFDDSTGQPMIADFGTVEALAADINTVAAMAADIAIVADADVDIATVADNIDEVIAVANAVGDGTIALVKDTYAALTAIPADERSNGQKVYVAVRATAGDGGEGWWRFDASSSATANGGTILAPDAGTGRWIRQVENGEYLVNWFGSSADWGAAATAALDALPSRGVVRFRPGGDYTLNTQVSSGTKSFFKIDISGCTIRPRFASGAAFKFGTGAVAVSNIAFVGDGACYIEGGTTAEQPLFELRGVRRFTTQGLRGDGLWQIAEWGDPADAVQCYEWWNTSCSLNLRTNANGGHSHAILGDGSDGGYYETDCFFEGDAANVAGSVSFFRLTSAQGPARFDGFTRSGGNWKFFDNGIYCVDARIVNVDIDPSSRFDDMESWAVYILTQAAATKGGVEQLNIHGHFGGTNGSGAVYVRDEKGTVGFDDISVTDVDTSNQKDAVVQITTSGSGAVRNVLINGVSASDFDPSSATKRVIELSGDITLASVDSITLRGKTGASNTAQYLIYNDTASTKRVKVGANLVWDSVNTAVVYDPNIGNLSIGRFCAVRPDGTPRGGPQMVGPFTINNIAASITNGDIGIRNDGGLAVLAVTAFDRCRVIGITASLLGTPSAGTLTINANPNASGADTNLQVAFTSADGANPRKRVLYPAGTASIAAAGSIRLLYTSDASWSPTTQELCVYQIVQEM
jgi:hypothetical protein